MALLAETQVRSELFPRFGVKLDDATLAGGRLAPDWINLREDPDRRRQVAQHLVDLGYLGSAEAAGEDRLLAAALERFYLEASGFFNQFERHAEDATLAPPPRLEPDVVLRAALVDPLRVSFSRLRLLQELTGFDGVLRLRGQPREGEGSLRTRVLRFRLATFNFLDRGDTVDRAGYDAAARAALERFARLLALPLDEPAGALRAMDLLGDAAGLVARFTTVFEGRELVAEVERSGRLEQRGHFRRPRRRPRRRSAIGRRRDLEEDPLNLFGLELLQVLLWMDGYYEGTIDLDWGPRSVEALKMAVAQEALDPARLLRQEQGFWLMDARYAMPRLLELVGEDEDVYAQQDTILDGIERAMEASPELDSWMALESRARERDAVVREKSTRRQYFGIGALVRALRKVAAWVKHAFDRFLERLRHLVGPVLQFIRFIGKGLRRALGFAALALRRLHLFATGQPFSTWAEPPLGLVMTQPDLGGDTRSFALGQVSPALVAEHHLELRRMNRLLGLVLGTAIEVAKLFVGGPLSWMAAGRAIFRIVRDRLEATPRERLAGAMLWS